MRFSTRGFDGDHFNFQAKTVVNGILSKGLLGKATMPAALAEEVSDLRSTANVLVDENIDLMRPYLKKFSLATVHELFCAVPTVGKVAVWHSVRLSMPLAKAYAHSWIDYVFIESYWPWKSKLLLYFFFKRNWKRAVKAGIVRKVVFVLGVNQRHPKLNLLKPMTWWGSIDWANNPETLLTQIGYIKYACPGTAGIGFFVASSSDSYLRYIDAVAKANFPEDSPIAVVPQEQQATS